jgi:AraC-like DNA-binding protein
MGSVAFEKHYRVKELAGLWGLSPKTVSRIFAEEVGVIRVANDGTGKRKYETLSIPESVASRVHERLGNQAFQPSLQVNQPLRIVRHTDRDAGTSSTKPRRFIKLKSAQELISNASV